MSLSKSFKVAICAELLAWLAVNDTRICIIYGLIVYAACRGLWAARKVRVRW